jgi:hypothetical protein
MIFFEIIPVILVIVIGGVIGILYQVYQLRGEVK